MGNAELESMDLSYGGHPHISLEGRKIELELSASDANVSILSRNSRQPITAKPPAENGLLNTSYIATRVTVHVYK